VERILEKLNRFFVARLRLAVLDETAGRWRVDPHSVNLPYLKAQNRNGRHILIKPARNIEPFYLLADDLTADLLNRHHHDKNEKWRPGRLVIETSPGNFQVWIHSSRFLTLDEKKFWLRKLHSDPGAHPKDRWGRCPGFRNRKIRHRNPKGGYPLARLIWIDWKNTALIPSSFSPLPSGRGLCVEKNLSRSNYERGNESVTDFAYALALARAGYTNSDIQQHLLMERKNWRHHQGDKRQKQPE